VDRRQPIFPVLLVLSTCVSTSSTTSSPPPPPPPPPPSGPFADFNHPDSATTAVQAFEAALAAPAYQSLVAFAPSLSIVGGHAPVPVSSVGAFRCAAGAAPLTPTGAFRPAGTSAIPDSLRSHVFAYDSASQAFHATASSGGPANGVRFLLAGVDTAGRPVFPLRTVGWLDLIDESAAGGPDSIAAVLADSGGPLLEYTMTPTGTVGTYSERVSGEFGGGGTIFQLVDSTSRIGTQVTVTTSVQDSAHHVHATLMASRTATDMYDWFYTLDFRLRFGTDSVHLKGASDVYCLLPSVGITVLVHDSAFASVTNGATPTTPNITRGDGNPTTAQQAAAVFDLIRLQGELFNWMVAFSLPGTLLLGS